MTFFAVCPGWSETISRMPSAHLVVTGYAPDNFVGGPCEFSGVYIKEAAPFYDDVPVAVAPSAAGIFPCQGRYPGRCDECHKEKNDEHPGRDSQNMFLREDVFVIDRSVKFRWNFDDHVKLNLPAHKGGLCDAFSIHYR
jgi:hypothetical protein